MTSSTWRLRPGDVGEPDLDLLGIHGDVRGAAVISGSAIISPIATMRVPRAGRSPTGSLRDRRQMERPAGRVPPPEVGVQQRHDVIARMRRLRLVLSRWRKTSARPARSVLEPAMRAAAAALWFFSATVPPR